MTSDADFIEQRLRQVPVLAAVLDALDPAAIAELDAGVEWYGIAGGTTLFEQGEQSHDVFVLLAGRLGVLFDHGLGARLVHHTVPGEMVGEMALISHEPRSATIVAIHDSEVLRIPGALAERLIASSPSFIAFLLAQLSTRLKEMTAGESKPIGIEVVAVVPIADDAVDDATAAAIRQGFAALGRSIDLVDERDGSAIDPPAAVAALRVDIARERGSVWARRAIRQADRVLFVAPAGTPPDAQAIGELARLAHRNKPADLMLVNPATARRPTGATPWLAHFAPDQVFHVKAGDADDHRRIARLVTGTAIGVALAGGGARGFAHIGAMRAIGEAGIPIDMICGTSMGALVGGSAALDVDLDEVKRKVHHSFVLNHPIGDYTVPLIALSRGRRMSALLQQHFDDALIEDCWRPFFCVSSNLTTGAAQVHRQGLMRRALRASSSLPGIVPPLIEGSDVLVDGALMNNFPVDIMAGLARGRVIGIDIAAGTTCRAEEADIESRSLMWLLGKGRRKVPNILKLLMRSGLVASDFKAEANRKAADLLIQPDLGSVDLLSFNRYQEAIDGGYRGTKEVLEALPTPFF